MSILFFCWGRIVSSIFLDKWIWITVISVFLIVVLPLVVVWGILNLPADFRIIATICIIVLWGVVSGYKDWIISKRQEKEQEKV
jgi:uncharacterized membrane protein